MDLHCFIDPWLRVRCGRIFLLLVLCSMLVVKIVVNAEAEIMCYQGKIVTSKAQKISLSKKSLSDFSLKKCEVPATTTPEHLTTEIMTTLGDIPTTSAGMTDAPATSSTSNGPVASKTASPGNSPSSAAPPSSNPPSAQKTATPQNTVGPTSTASNSQTSKANASSAGTTLVTSVPVTSTAASNDSADSMARRRRSQDDNQLTDQGPSLETDFFCQVFSYQTIEGDKVNVNSNYTLEFSCATEDVCNGSKTAEVTMPNGRTATAYCCQGSACNSPLNFTRNVDTKIKVETLQNCSWYNDAGEFQSVPCVKSDTHMCLNITNKENQTQYTCGNEVSETLYCLDDNWYSKKCQTENEKKYCCYVEPTFVKGPPDDDDDNGDHGDDNDKDGKMQNSSVGLIIGVLVAFTTGLFLGCMGLVILQKKCSKGRTSGIEMDFSYSRFQSADSGTDEL